MDNSKKWNHIWLMLDELTLSSAPTINRSSLRNLDKVAFPTQLNPSMAEVSQRAYKLAKDWLQWADLSHGKSLPTHISTPGDGSLIIEWTIAGKRVSAWFDSQDDDTDLLISRIGDRESVPFSATMLEQYLDQLVAHNAITNTIPSKDQNAFEEYTAYASESIGKNFSIITQAA